MAHLRGISTLPRQMSAAHLHCRLDSLLGSKQSMTVGNNTVLRRTGRYCYIALRLHGTDVVTIGSGGSITLDSGGWESPTTKERMNQILNRVGYAIVQRDWHWHVNTPSGVDAYEDGYYIANDTVSGEVA